jgi:hypothetical protein
VAYVRSVVYSESELIMKRWRTKDEDSKPVIETRSERCNDTAPFVAEDIQIRSVKEVTVVRRAALGILRGSDIDLINPIMNVHEYSVQYCTILYRVCTTNFGISRITISNLIVFNPLPSLPSYRYFRTMGSQQNLPRVRRDIKFRVLIIGRANAGKTSILQRVCDTTDNPWMYRVDESGARTLVCSHSMRLLSPSSTPSSHQLQQLDQSQEVKQAYISSVTADCDDSACIAWRA